MIIRVHEVKSTMAKKLFYFFISILFFHFSACGSQQDENEKVLAKINDYQMTLKEFRTQLTSNLEFEKGFKLTQEAKEQFLDSLIGKEVLIQEAMKLKLDRKKRFIDAIERYWQATLIKNLMELKMEEIKKSVYISQEEIEANYDKMKQSQANLPPLSDIREKIAKKIKEEKNAKVFANWIKELKQNAKIEINQELLSKN
jgi:hypothetical protein